MRKSVVLCSILAAAAGLSTGVANAQPVAATVVLKVGDPIGNDGATVTGVGQPYVNGLGKVGFVVMQDQPAGVAGRSIWYDGAVIFEAFNSPDMPTGSEDTMGISDVGGFIYSPSVSGNDAVYTNFGSLLKDGDPLPNNPGFFSVFNSRPRMADDGVAFWIGGYGPATVTTHRALFRNATPADPGATTIVVGTGDTIQGVTVAPSTTSSFTYDISPNGQHALNVFSLSTTSTTDHALIKDATTIVAQEGMPTGFGDNWKSSTSSSTSPFDAVGINNSGNWILAGETDNPNTGIDGVLVYNGQLAVREGDIVAGVLLGGLCSAASIDNNNRVIFSWNPTATETVFVATAPDIAGTAQVLLRVGDELDVDNDGIADFTVNDFNGSYSIANAFDLSVNGPIFLNVDLRTIGGTSDIEAIIALGDVGGPDCPADWNEDAEVNSGDISAFLTAWLDSVNNMNLIADFNNDMVVNSGDISAFLTAWLDAVQNGC